MPTLTSGVSTWRLRIAASSGAKDAKGSAPARGPDVGGGALESSFLRSRSTSFPLGSSATFMAVFSSMGASLVVRAISMLDVPLEAEFFWGDEFASELVRGVTAIA